MFSRSIGPRLRTAVLAAAASLALGWLFTTPSGTEPVLRLICPATLDGPRDPSGIDF